MQRFGGHTFVNMVRSGGVLYKEILCEVCDKQKVSYSKDDKTIAIENALITKMFKNITESLAKEDPKKLEAMMKEIQPENANGLYMYQLSAIVASAVMQTFGMTTAVGAAAFASVGATLGIGKVVGLINPILMGITTLWLVSDIMGPAYRVTIPAAFQIAFLRQRHIHRKKIEELEKNHKEILVELEAISDELEEDQKIKLATKIMEHLKVKLNILVVGATGVGKSSTIAALFKNGKDFVEIGTDSKPQTQNIEKFVISNNITLWDSPGLGEGEEKDKKHKDNIIAKLQEKDKDGNALIDLVLVILDATNKDLETAYKLINKVIIPNMPNKDRILIVLNKCDCVIDRVDFVENGRKLTDKQIQYLDSKVNDIQERVKKDTGVDVEPIYYSAGLKKENKLQETPYNITKLLYFITKKTPPIKR
ncbi:GTPase, partial [Helicobacter bilis]|uniref:GTPase n=5 Tax=Helicobacter bilis TaxID=37372 RepID=UPI0034C6AAD3